MNILVTGASGFVGQYLVNFLLEKGANISTLGRTESIGSIHYPLSLPWNKKEIFSIVKKVKPDYFFHLIGNSQEKNINDSEEINSSLGAILLDAIIDCGFQKKTRCLVFGSAAEYGLVKDTDLPLSENYKCSPSGIYGINKLKQTNYALKCSQEGGFVTVIRPFCIVGKKLPAYMAVGNFSNQINDLISTNLKKGTLITGNINVGRDFIDVNDVVDICWKLINNDKANGQIINVCSSKSVELKNIIEYMANLNGLELSIQVNKSLLRKNDPKNHYGDNKKLIELIKGYQFTPLEKSLKNIMDKL